MTSILDFDKITINDSSIVQSLVLAQNEAKLIFRLSVIL